MSGHLSSKECSAIAGSVQQAFNDSCANAVKYYKENEREYKKHECLGDLVKDVNTDWSARSWTDCATCCSLPRRSTRAQVATDLGPRWWHSVPSISSR